MPAQEAYYNNFARQNRASLLACEEPWFWTTDYAQQGRIYREMKERVEQQMALIAKSFNPALPILDIGCGFGRQALALARKGFSVTGIDSSEGFVQLARELAERNGWTAQFYTATPEQLPAEPRYPQVLLLDVLEHVAPRRRKPFLRALEARMTTGGCLLVSLPRVKPRWRSRLNNSVRRRITGPFAFFRNREEHPYYIPGPHDLRRYFAASFEWDSFTQTTETDYYFFRRR